MLQNIVQISGEKHIRFCSTYKNFNEHFNPDTFAKEQGIV